MLALISSTQHMFCIARTADRLGIWFYFLPATINLKKKKVPTVDQKHMTRAISNSATRSISNTFLVPSDAALFDLTKTTAKPTHTLL